MPRQARLDALPHFVRNLRTRSTSGTFSWHAAPRYPPQWGTVMNLCDSLSWEVGLHSSTAVRGGRSRAPRVGQGAPIRMIRERRCATVEQGQMIVAQ